MSAPRCRLAIYREVAVICRVRRGLRQVRGKISFDTCSKTTRTRIEDWAIGGGVVWTGILVLVVAVMEGWHWVSVVFGLWAMSGTIVITFITETQDLCRDDYAADDWKPHRA